MIVNNAMHTSHAINFFLYVFFVPVFRMEFIHVFNMCRDRTQRYNQAARAHSLKSYFMSSNGAANRTSEPRKNKPNRSRSQ
jgi:hypothetical protein